MSSAEKTGRKMTTKISTPARVRWARLRFSIVGPLLAAPPEPGELGVRLRELAAQTWRHPTTAAPLRFSVSTIERWLYTCRTVDDPLSALARKIPKHSGTHPSITAELASAIATQYQQHPSWNMQLHYDNLVTLAKQDPKLLPLPSYPTVRRYMKDQGLRRQKRGPKRESSTTPPMPRETRSYEMTHVHALWHLDFHEGSRKVLCPSGEWKKPFLFGVLDDYSRLCCHLQWYLDQTAESLIHGLCQALQKRGLPRALLTDNGAAMLAAETVEGLERLGILHETTLPYSPEQNGKQENFWARVEGRLLPMLEGEPELTLALLNQATLAWVEQEYHRQLHSEIGCTPLGRLLSGRSVVRPCPTSEALRRAFRTEVTRRQRHSDGTIPVEGVRFEVPSRYHSLEQLTVRVARWDLGSVDLVDRRSGKHLCTLLPLDKEKNADRARRVIAGAPLAPAPAPSGIAPRMRELMADYAATGLPPAYLPKHDDPFRSDPNDDHSTDEGESE
jgi:transposase InsO family protein